MPSEIPRKAEKLSQGFNALYVPPVAFWDYPEMGMHVADAVLKPTFLSRPFSPKVTPLMPACKEPPADSIQETLYTVDRRMKVQLTFVEMRTVKHSIIEGAAGVFSRIMFLNLEKLGIPMETEKFAELMLDTGETVWAVEWQRPWIGRMRSHAAHIFSSWMADPKVSVNQLRRNLFSTKGNSLAEAACYELTAGKVGRKIIYELETGTPDNLEAVKKFIKANGWVTHS